MAFRKMTPHQYPLRLWSLVGYPGSGKSSFAAQMKAPMLAIDADHRFSEVLGLVEGDVYELSETRSDNVNPEMIRDLLNDNMPGSDVKTIVVDSLTAIITPLVVQAIVDKDSGKRRNLMASFRTKALAMRTLQDAVSRWGSDVLWIYHLQNSRDGKAKEIQRKTISQTELARLTRSINLQLEIVQTESRRGIKVVWARRGRSGQEIGTLWDDTGCWRGMPERIEESVYGGLTPEEQRLLEQDTPTVFKSPEVAISWAYEKGAFVNVERAKSYYDKIKLEHNPKSAKEMRDHWIEAVEERIKEATKRALDAVEDDGVADSF